MAKKPSKATKAKQDTPSPSGRKLLQEIYAEHTAVMSREDCSPEEWASNPAHFAEEALKALKAGEADAAVFWAMSASIGHWGSQFLGQYRNPLTVALTRFKGIATWQNGREEVKLNAAARYDALLQKDGAMKQSAVLRKAVEGTDLSPRTLRGFIDNRGPLGLT